MKNITLVETNLEIKAIRETLISGDNDWNQPLTYTEEGIGVERSVVANRVTYKGKVRQDIFSVHKDTETISIKMNGIRLSNGTKIPDNPSCTHTFSENYKKYYHLVSPIIDKCISHYGHGFVNSINIIKMLPNTSIGRHRDSGETLEKSLRFHVPIVTNDKVMFTVGNETINMKEGCCYLINNQSLHNVTNETDCDRIHLIFDLYIKNGDE